jgi:hypothetical protein
MPGTGVRADSTRTERIARCGHPYWGSPTGAVRKHCRDGCPVEVPLLALPGRPRSVDVAARASLWVDASTARALSDRTGDGSRTGALAELLRAGAARLDGGPVPWGAYTAPGGYRRVAQESVHLDAALAAVVDRLAGEAAACGVRGARSAVLRALLAAGLASGG